MLLSLHSDLIVPSQSIKEDTPFEAEFARRYCGMITPPEAEWLRRSCGICIPGLSLIPFECKRFKIDDKSLKVPHMGWDIVEYRKKHSILNNIKGQQRYYFVHSYHAVCDSKDNVLMTCDYGYEFDAAVVNDNVIGVQFHPEKSHNFGMTLLDNFVAICRGN